MKRCIMFYSNILVKKHELNLTTYQDILANMVTMVFQRRKNMINDIIAVIFFWLFAGGILTWLFRDHFRRNKQ